MFKYPFKDFDPIDRMEEETIKDWPDSPVSPDDNFTLREIVDNFTRGLPTSVHVYESGTVDDRDLDDDSPLDYIDVSTMDLAEITELRAALSARSATLRKKLKEQSNTVETHKIDDSSTQGDSSHQAG